MIPAPEHFQNLKQHLENSGVNVSALREAIATYLTANKNITEDFGSIDDHQVYYYRNILEEFLATIQEDDN